MWPRNLMDDLGKQYCTSSILHQALCIISKPSVNSNWSCSPEMSNSGKIVDFLSSVTLKFNKWPWKILGHLFYPTSSFVHHFIAISENKLELQSGNYQFGSKWAAFCPMWPWNLMDDLDKIIGHIFYITSSFVHHFIAISDFKLELQSGNTQFGSKSAIFFVPCHLEIW